MSIIVYLIPIALCLGMLGLAGFIWSVQSGQYEDMQGPAYRMLEEDDHPD